MIKSHMGEVKIEGRRAEVLADLTVITQAIMESLVENGARGRNKKLDYECGGFRDPPGIIQLRGKPCGKEDPGADRGNRKVWRAQMLTEERGVCPAIGQGMGGKMEGKDRKKGDLLRTVVILMLGISMLLTTIRVNKIQQENKLIVSYLIENTKIQITNHQMNEKIFGVSKDCGC